MQTSSSRAKEPIIPAGRRPVDVTGSDLALVESRFDSQMPGSAWCGYGTSGVEGEMRLVLFVNLVEQRALTLTRYGDGAFEVSSETGACWPETALDAILDRLTQIGRAAA